ncbi:3-mercaptopyruvate sulfurtransferase isoform X1 [Paramuricea clavata]|uniref:3-mercaptopyruvate sulfurtransferase isoform X1 n=1 Tax=Paramuricea clavata TaxID=317549 RepID=A0A6S7GKJ8_PARCT|nr:3-mercaptopyruvate sulfurtransferase isoform X1 [Paramuricea clavata]
MKIPSLVNVQWLAQAILKTKPQKSLSIVDGTWRIKGAAVESRKDYIEKHIPGAVFFDIDECSDKTSKYQQMLPDEKLFAEYVKHLGISNDSHIITYDFDDDFGLFSSPRVWWMFRCFGHEAISVLNGGFRKWLDAGLPVESGEPPIRLNQPYNAKLNPKLVQDYEAMAANVRTGGIHTVADALPKEMMAGQIPFSGHIPFPEFLEDNNQMLKDSEQLKKVFAENNVDLNRPLTATCGTGITACIMALAAHHCGAKDVSVYDGSWEEWGDRATSDSGGKN